LKKHALALALSLAALVAPAAAQDAPAAPAAQTASLSVDSPMPELIADPEAKAILEAQLGADLVNNPRLQSAPLSLRALGAYIPSLTEEKLNQINAELSALAPH
jgi:hypothetical protein